MERCPDASRCRFFAASPRAQGQVKRRAQRLEAEASGNGKLFPATMIAATLLTRWSRFLYMAATDKTKNLMGRDSRNGKVIVAICRTNSTMLLMAKLTSTRSLAMSATLTATRTKSHGMPMRCTLHADSFTGRSGRSACCRRTGKTTIDGFSGRKFEPAVMSLSRGTVS